MSSELNRESELENAHVLFIDAVGYAKLLINEQRELFDFGESRERTITGETQTESLVD